MLVLHAESVLSRLRIKNPDDAEMRKWVHEEGPNEKIKHMKEVPPEFLREARTSS